MADGKGESWASSLRSFDFVISRSVQDIPETLTRKIFEEWHLGHSEGLTCSEFVVPGYDKVLLLTIVDPNTYLRGGVGDLEDLEQRLIGGVVMVLRKGKSIEVRSDACGMLPVVFAPENKIIASCPSLIDAQNYSPERCAMTRSRDTFFPFGLTTKPGVRRLLPNHTLYLGEFEVQRSWHIEELQTSDGPDALIDQMVDALREILSQLHSLAPLYVPLTAGRDSRALIACCSDLQNIRTFTNLLDDAAIWDSTIATQISHDLNLDYSARPFIKPDADSRENWLKRIGYCVGGRVSYGFLSPPRDNSSWLVSGLCGEVGRNYYPSIEGRPDPIKILQTIKTDVNESSLEAAEEWLQPLADLSNRQLADLLYLEIRLGCWAGPQMACPAQFLGKIAPFGHRRIVDCMLQLPATRRARNHVPQQIIAEANQRLLRFRFSKEGKREMLRVGLERIGLHKFAQKL